MCGIWAVVGHDYSPSLHHQEFMKIVGRGPDLTVISRIAPQLWLGFHRLSIVQPGDIPSSQPIVGDGLAVVCNGEIYNHKELKRKSTHKNELFRNGGSDCAAILHAFRLAENNLSKCCTLLDGVFAFTMADRNNLYIGRDPLGVRPLFYGTTKHGLIFGSEVKCIEKLCRDVYFFPPGCCATIKLLNTPLQNLKDAMQIERYHSIPLGHIERPIGALDAQEIIRKLLTDAVEKRLMGNRRFGFLLSGGLDSSLIAALATRFVRTISVNGIPTAFSIGFCDSPDIEKAKLVAKHLCIPHVVHTIDPSDCISIVPDVIYALETFDAQIIRCGILHFLLCQFIAKTSDVKILFSGEGADELFGAYAYMQRAPTPGHLHGEINTTFFGMTHTINNHFFDSSDRCTSCHGLEVRVPFLDKKFVDFVSKLPPSYKIGPDKMEKHLLRSAFEGWLPDEVLWRSKEGFSEAMGAIDLGTVLEKHSERLISDTQFEQSSVLFPWKTPQTKEEFWYRAIFEKFFALNKLETIVHTKVYRTASWQLDTMPFLAEPPIVFKKQTSLESNNSDKENDGFYDKTTAFNTYTKLNELHTNQSKKYLLYKSRSTSNFIEQ